MIVVALALAGATMVFWDEIQERRIGRNGKNRGSGNEEADAEPDLQQPDGGDPED